MIRPLRPSDAVAIGFLRVGSGGHELTAATWPKTPPESREPGFFDLLRHSVLPLPREHPIGVSKADRHINGFVVGVGRAAGLVWDVDHLRAEDAEIAVQLLRWVCERAVTAGARRVFIETASENEAADDATTSEPTGGEAMRDETVSAASIESTAGSTADGNGNNVARRSSFERYSGGAMWRLDPGFSRDAENALPARPRLRADESGLFQLYNAAVPANVRVAEAMTNEEWASLYRGRKLWTPKLLGDRQDYVWELGSRVAGWMRVVYGQRAQFLELVIHPMYESYADRMVQYALVQMSTKVPVLADVREYQGSVGAALQRAGFRAGNPYAVWVRQLAERVLEPSRAAVRAPASPSA